MKQYTTPEQTAKLIELGFVPKTKLPFEVANDELGYTYSIGELIEMLQTVKHSCLLIYNLGFDQRKVVFKKLNGRWEYKYREIGDELIDLLFNAIVNLKEEGVI